MVDLDVAVNHIATFLEENLRGRISRIENSLENAKKQDIENIMCNSGINDELFNSALSLKNFASTINIIIHAVGIVTSLPYIINDDEKIQYVSLGAGNTGKRFDLETNNRIAEFKFIHWQGGSETIRQNGIFKDFYYLEREPTTKEKYLYLTGTTHAISFFNRRRAIKSVLSQNNTAMKDFYNSYKDRYAVVNDYYSDVKSKVKIVDLASIAPQFTSMESSTT